MKRKGIIVVILIFAIWSSKSVFSQEVAAQDSSKTKFSLEEARQWAVENNINVVNALRDIEKAKKKVWETTAIGLPQASGSFAYSYMLKVPESIEQFSSLSNLGLWMYGADQALFGLTQNPAFGNIPNPGEPEESDPDDLKTTATLDITVSQLIFSGSYLVGLQASKAYKSLSELAYSKSKTDIIESVSNAYFMVLIAEENKSILDSTYQNISRLLFEIEAMYEQGFVEDTDVDQLRLTAQNIENTTKMLNRQIVLAYRLLKFQMGIELNHNIILTDNLEEILTQINIEDSSPYAAFSLENNVNYQLLESQVKLQELNLKLNKSEYLPTIAGFYMHQENFNENAFTFTPPDLIGLNVSIPIFSSGQRNAKVAQAKIELEKTKDMKFMASQGLMLEYNEAKTAYMTALDKYITEKDNMILSEKIYKKTTIKYKEGMVSSMDLTQVQNQHLQTQSNYFSASMELLNAKTKLEKILARN